MSVHALRRSPKASRRLPYASTTAVNIDEEGTDPMGSNGKKKTTMAKLMRETRLRERRLEKQVKKDLRKRAAADGPAAPADEPTGEHG